MIVMKMTKCLSVPHVPSIALLIFIFWGLLSRVQLSVPVRLRRAILMNDVLLVKRIVKNNPRYLENPDFADRGNTSLHLAAIKGHADIVVSRRGACVAFFEQGRRRES